MYHPLNAQIGVLQSESNELTRYVQTKVFRVSSVIMVGLSTWLHHHGNLCCRPNGPLFSSTSAEKCLSLTSSIESSYIIWSAELICNVCKLVEPYHKINTGTEQNL